MQDGNITSTIDNGIATISFFHPAQNSLPGHLLEDLVQHINTLSSNNEVLFIVLKSEGQKAFCAGASFTELASIHDYATAVRFFSGFANVINAIRKSRKLFIGRIHGKAVGGGVGLAAACDYCLASKYASVRLSELAVGIGPFVIGPAVERKVGLSAFSQMAINADEWQTASWAKEKGLFMEVFDTTEQLDDYLVHFSKALGQKSPLALAKIKEVLWAGTNEWDNLLIERAKISGELILTNYARTAIGHFLNKSSH